jgi:hypothetical protein
MHDTMMRQGTRGRAFAVATLVAMTTAIGGIGAQDSTAAPVPMPPSASDPPSVAGRIAFLQGAVSYRPAQGDTWALAELNRAVGTGDRLWVDTVGHAEVEIGHNALRMSAQTEIDFTHLDDHGIQFRIPQGTATLRVKSFGAGGIYEIDAPNAAITLGESGDYRVDVSPDGQTTNVTVWNGQARVTAAGSTFEIDPNKTATVTGDSAPTYDIADARAPDAFDEWCRSRDAREDKPGPSAQYVSADMGGVEELDNYGSWATEADYGPVWYPPTDIAVGWAPYHFGHWVWEWPWGWTWVEDEPWGWAPFHYGRWAFIGSRWGWCPGAELYRPVFAPALVGFVGGPGWGVSVGFGGGFGVGWFPLGPREPFFPGYANSIAYRERINVTNYRDAREITNVNVTNITYRNRIVAGAVTAVPQTAFERGEAVDRVAVRVTPNEIASAHFLGAAPGVTPTARSLAPIRGGVGGRGVAMPPGRLATRSVVALHAPAPTPVPFSLQRQAIAANGGRPLSRPQVAALRTSSGALVSARALPVRSAALTVGDHALTPARGGLPATRPAISSGVPTRAVGVPSGRPASQLDQEYQTERNQMESRHVQEFARPPAGESEQGLRERQEVEHQQLEQRYNSAQRSGAVHLPPPSGGGGGRRR